MRATRWLCFLLSLVVLACGSPQATQQPAAKVKVGNDGAEIEATAAGIKAYVTSNAYRQWTAEPMVHDATGNSPHGKARVFFNKLSYDALKAQVPSLPVGSMLVKELVNPDGVTLAGYSAMVKTTASSWTWWEAFVGSLDNPAAFGVDLGSCKGCHGAGANRDQVHSAPP